MKFEDGKEFLVLTVFSKVIGKVETIYESNDSSIAEITEEVLNAQEDKNVIEIHVTTFKIEELAKTIITKRRN